MAVPALITGWIAGVGLALLLIYVINPLSFGWSINFRWHIAAFYIPALALLISIALSCMATLLNSRTMDAQTNDE